MTRKVPIPFVIMSLLDVDYYKFTMGQFLFHWYRNNIVEFGFHNRTSIRLADIIPIKELRRQLDHVRTLRFRPEELAFLVEQQFPDGTRTFKKDYIRMLGNLRLPAYRLRVVDGQFDLVFKGKPFEVTMWETISLSIINELYYLYTEGEPEKNYPEGDRRLYEKIGIFREHPRIRIMEFGTRRRYSRAWQEHVTRILIKELPDQIVGTSNVLLAMKLGIRPMGTMAHELFMIVAALNDATDEQLRASHNLVLRQWWEEYGYPLSIALTDTFGSEFFFRDFTPEQGRMWRGTRWDSGDAFQFTEERVLPYYARIGVDPLEKTVVYSDGLETQLVVEIEERYGVKLQALDGIGTFLSNDLGVRALSIVCKAISADGHMTVKLSDNPAKAQGPEALVERYKRVFEYHESEYVVTKY